jgi:hypothetical protein
MRDPNDNIERDKVCVQYEAWLESEIQKGTPSVLRELSRLEKLAEEGALTLGCYCSPKRCHGDSIKKVIERRLELKRSKEKPTPTPIAPAPITTWPRAAAEKPPQDETIKRMLASHLEKRSQGPQIGER